MAPGAAPVRRTDTLAYEHTVSIETSKDLLPMRLREVEGACNTDRPSACTILDISLSSQQDLPHGSIRMRLAPAGLEPIIALASKDAKVTGRSTHAAVGRRIRTVASSTRTCTRWGWWLSAG